MAVEFGIDIGTNTTQVYSVETKSIVVNEPTVVVQNPDGEIVAAGHEALEMFGKTPDGLTVETPVKDGGITNFSAAVGLLKTLMRGSVNSVFSKMRVAAQVPSGIGDVERRAVEEVMISAGAGEVYLIEAPLAGAIGAGVDVNEPKGYAIVDVGAGTTEAAVISLGGIVVAKSIKVGGNTIDEDIIQHIKKRYNIEISHSAAEKLKIRLASAIPGITTDVAEVKGKDMYNGVPKNIVISSSEVNTAIRDNVAAIVENVRCMLEETPPELSSDLLETGIILTGGGVNLTGLGKLIQHNTGITVYQAQDPECSVAIGAGMAVSEMGGFKNMLIKPARKKNY